VHGSEGGKACESLPIPIMGSIPIARYINLNSYVFYVFFQALFFYKTKECYCGVIIDNLPLPPLKSGLIFCFVKKMVDLLPNFSKTTWLAALAALAALDRFARVSRQSID